MVDENEAGVEEAEEDQNPVEEQGASRKSFMETVGQMAKLLLG